MEVEAGDCFPFGATVKESGVNFAVYGKDIQELTLLLFHEKAQEANKELPFSTLTFNPDVNKTGDVWHIFVKDLPLNFGYNYKVVNKDGSFASVLDPYAKLIISEPLWQNESRQDFKYNPIGKVVAHQFDWQGDKPLNLAKNDLIIYEMHVRGFTKHFSSNVSAKGTFQGIIEKIPYLKDLGINAIELMPIQEFCEEDVTQFNPETGKKNHNYFGYSTVNFFSLMNRYSSKSEGDQALTEFKNLVKELHKNGIEIILDMVLNHTSEGNEKGPVQSYKAFNPLAYYHLGPNNTYQNYSGCGNTFKCNHPVSLELLMSAMRYYVLECHIDGFRFDLASIFSRGLDGGPIERPPLLEFISEDPILSHVKLIAEPWDAVGLYQVGYFAALNPHWSEWNGKYQSAIRNFIKGTKGSKKSFSEAISGNFNIYPNIPTSSVNYIVTHDGFNLADLVSYNEKHNLNNGENNKDGLDNNESWNCGVEGETEDKNILNLRKKQMRNFLLALMVTPGIPMLFMGDEYGHTKKGNNNSWTQDNEINWFLWDKIQENQDFFNFYRFLIHFKAKNPLLKPEKHLKENHISWHGLVPNQPKWEEKDHFVAFTLNSEKQKNEPVFYIAFNASNEDRDVVLPPCQDNKNWHQVIVTGNKSPEDFFEDGKEVKVENNLFKIAPYSSILLKAF